MNLINFSKVQAAFLGIKTQYEPHISIPDPAFGSSKDEKGLFTQTGNLIYFITDPSTIETLTEKYGVTDKAPIYFKEVEAMFLGYKSKCEQAIHVPYIENFEYITDEEGVYVQSGSILYFISDKNTADKIKSEFKLGE